MSTVEATQTGKPTAEMAAKSEKDHRAIEALTEYLRIPSVHPDVDYGPCEEWVRSQAKEMGLPVQVIRPKSDQKPVVIITWVGSEPTLPSIMLNSHMDVVPVFQGHWTYDAFSATRTPDGKIYARGSQDMKSVAVQYVEAVRRLREQDFKPRRTIHITFVPDEEIGGEDGMEAFVQTNEFANMNVGFGLDEGMCWPGEEVVLFYTERSNWKLEFVCPGTPGHGSQLMEDIAADKVRVILDRVQDYRASQKAKITSPIHQGLVTAVNVTMLQGGVQNNVVPPEMKVIVDVRLAPAQNHDEFFNMLQDWCTEAGPGTEVRIPTRGPVEGVTHLNESNIWWAPFKEVLEKTNLKVLSAVCPGSTDARFLRRMGIPALGITFMNNTPILLHAHDEYVHEKIFLKGIDIYMELLKKLTMVE